MAVCVGRGQPGGTAVRYRDHHLASGAETQSTPLSSQARAAVLSHMLVVEHYAIGLPTGSELRELMNRVLLQALYSPAWKTLLQRYVNVAE
jgi:ABC-type amino acid transport substrate-binding protein